MTQDARRRIGFETPVYPRSAAEQAGRSAAQQAAEERTGLSVCGLRWLDTAAQTPDAEGRQALLDELLEGGAAGLEPLLPGLGEWLLTHDSAGELRRYLASRLGGRVLVRGELCRVTAQGLRPVTLHLPPNTAVSELWAVGDSRKGAAEALWPRLCALSRERQRREAARPPLVTDADGW